MSIINSRHDVGPEAQLIRNCVNSIKLAIMDAPTQFLPAGARAQRSALRIAAGWNVTAIGFFSSYHQRRAVRRGFRMKERFEGANAPALIDGLKRQEFTRGDMEIVEALRSVGSLEEFKHR